MSSLWLVPVVAIVVGAAAAAFATRRLRVEAASLQDDAATLVAVGSDADAVALDVASLRTRVHHTLPGTGVAPGGR